MKKLIGNLDSKKSEIFYRIFWDTEEKTVWRFRLEDWYEMIGYNALDEDSALRIARVFLNLQV